MIIRKCESLRKCWNVLFVHIGYSMYMCLCILQSTMFEYLFSVNIIRGNDESVSNQPKTILCSIITKGEEAKLL